MKWLGFERYATRIGGRRVRAASFEERSLLPVGAACVVASGIRERLGAVLDAAVRVRLFEPAIPSPHAWESIARGARIVRIRGSAADAAIVLRPGDALALACAAYGETWCARSPFRELSALEGRALDRIVTAVAETLAPVCGTFEREPPERLATLAGFVSYFEVLIESPLEARLGIALSRDPAPERRSGLRPEDLDDVAIEAVARVDLGEIAAAALAALAPGAIVPITHWDGSRGSLHAAGRTLAVGACGIRNGRYAFIVGAA